MTTPAQSSSSSTVPLIRNPRRVGSTDTLTIVIKLGTSSIVSDVNLQPRLAQLSSIVETCINLKNLGHKVVLVSSGAIGMGMRRMTLSDASGKWSQRPKTLAEKQALAAIGQGHLISLWDNLFSQLNQPIGQILLTRNDLADRSRYLNATSTLTTLLNSGVIPIVNENDTVSVSEIKFGDNDTLSAITAGMCCADYLFLLTDVDALYTKNPRRHPDARPVLIVRDIERVRELVSTATLGTSLGTGGMETKLIAAELATAAGVATVICHGAKSENILNIITTPPEYHLVADAPTLLGKAASDGTANATVLHTLFLPKSVPMTDRKFWIAHGLAPRGSVIIDEGASRAIAREGGRLLAAGVIRVEGHFMTGQAVRVLVLKGSKGTKPSTTTKTGSTPMESSTSSSGHNTPTGMLIFSASTSTTDLHASTNEMVQQLSINEETTIAGEGEVLIEVGRGLANYHAQEIDRIKGLKSSKIESVLGHIDSEHVVDSIALLRLQL